MKGNDEEVSSSSPSSELSSFFNSGVYHLHSGSNAVFLDPVRILNGSYTRFSLSRSAYYSRTFQLESLKADDADSSNSNSKKKKKRKRKASRDLNERDIAAENRHQEVRPLLVNAHSVLLKQVALLASLPDIVKGDKNSVLDDTRDEQNFIELAGHQHSSLYEISLCLCSRKIEEDDEGLCMDCDGGKTKVPVFTNLISNKLVDDMDSEFHDRQYILPSRSCFYMV